jgi:hypothetical protein
VNLGRDRLRGQHQRELVAVFALIGSQQIDERFRLHLNNRFRVVNVGGSAPADRQMPDRDSPDPALRCYRCGSPLEALSLPLSRLDLCPECSVELHVCRMCRHFAPNRPEQCDEDDAIEVTNKTVANFCDYFSPSASAFGGAELDAENEARRKLDALFGDAPAKTDTSEDSPLSQEPDSATAQALEAAESLFRK